MIFSFGDNYIFVFPEAATGGVHIKKVFLKISQNSKENTYARVSQACSFNKIGDSGTGVFL